MGCGSEEALPMRRGAKGDVGRASPFMFLIVVNA